MRYDAEIETTPEFPFNAEQSMEATLSRRCQSEFNRGDRQRGEEYMARGAVNILDMGTLGVRALVEGSGNNYEVLIDLEELDDETLFAQCECPRFDSGYLCKHIWATILELERLRDFRFVGQHSIDIFESDPDDFQIGDPLPASRYRPTLPATTTNNGKTAGSWLKQLQLATKIASSKSPFSAPPPPAAPPAKLAKHYFLISLADQTDAKQIQLMLARSIQNSDGQWSLPVPVRLDKPDTLHLRNPQEQRIFAMLQWESEYQHTALERLRRGIASTFRIHPHLQAETLSALSDANCLGWTMDISASPMDPTPLKFDSGPAWDLSISLDTGTSKNNGQINVTPVLQRTVDGQPQRREISRVMAVCDTGAILWDDCIAIANPQHTSWIRGWQRIGELNLPAAEIGTFLETLHSTPSMPPLQIPESLNVEHGTGKPQPKLTLQAPGDSRVNELTAKVTMLYGSREFALNDDPLVVWDEESRQLLTRDIAAESAAMAAMNGFEFRRYYVRYNEYELAIHRRWFAKLVTELSAAGWQVVAEGRLMRSAGEFHIEVASGEDWFDLNASVDFDGVQATLPTLLQALKKGNPFVVLDDGTQGILPEEWLKRFAGLADAGQVEGDSVRYRRNQALLLDMLLAEQKNVKTDRSFNTWCDRMRSFSGIEPAKPPRGFQGELREYQKDGLGWFHFLREFEFGGCLADDMGLGKTIQVLALLQSRRLARPKAGQARKPSLAVVPKSLIFNWIAEAKKFAPRLNIIDYTGAERRLHADQLESADLVLTTYGTMLRDIEQLRSIAYDYAILDEAQAIKNPKSQSAKAARLINADHRLAMTGTPVENHLGDLWSLLDFLNPGMLGQMSVGNFSNGDSTEQRMQALNTALRPFILRRTKEQVLTELPEKSEQTLHCDMSPKQRKMYDELRAHYRQHLSGKVKELGIKRSKIHVLEALLRLRQAACDPRLVNPKQGAPGAKIARLMEQLQEVTAEGHKALVFSQFTSLLALVRDELDKQGIAYEYLDGKTNKRNEHVERFQNDPACPVFLISLKAGGHGLNLTAADYVYILDPWWNPAVEAQAIDRAHRMGQTKPVIAYRLICRDTVEEKIVNLQESKRELADAIVSGDGSLISQLSVDDLQMLFG